jgi:hypothetical protein
MVGVSTWTKKVNCRYCRQPILKNELRFWCVGGEYMRTLHIYHWHLDCFLEDTWLDRPGRGLIRGIIEAYLPKFIGEDAAAPIILAMRLGKNSE